MVIKMSHYEKCAWGNWISLWWLIFEAHPFPITLERHLLELEGIKHEKSEKSQEYEH